MLYLIKSLEMLRAMKKDPPKSLRDDDQRCVALQSDLKEGNGILSVYESESLGVSNTLDSRSENNGVEKGKLGF